MTRHQRTQGRHLAGLAGLLLLAVGCGSKDNTQAPIVPPPDEAPPISPVGMSVAKATEAGFSVTWTPNGESDLAGYRVYVLEPGVDASYRLANPDHLLTTNRYAARNSVGLDGEPLSEVFLRVSAVDQSDNESPPSSAFKVGLYQTSNPVSQDPDAEGQGGGTASGPRGGTTSPGPGKEKDDNPQGGD